LAGERVTGILPKYFGRMGSAGLLSWDSDLIRVAYLLNDLVRAVVLVSELLAWTIACPVLGGYPHLVTDVPVDGSTVFVCLYLLPFLGPRDRLLAPFPGVLDEFDVFLCFLTGFLEMCGHVDILGGLLPVEMGSGLVT
jgi:hypothetical protein